MTQGSFYPIVGPTSIRDLVHSSTVQDPTVVGRVARTQASGFIKEG
jgi:hypothetical protein